MITIGLEEEIQVVDEHGALARHRSDHPAPGAVAQDWTFDEAGKLDKEIHRCVIEVQTRICRTVPELQDCLRMLRIQAIDKAAQQGQNLVVAGLHPFSVWQEQELHEGENHPYYTVLLDEYRDITRSALSFGMHLHLGLPDHMPKMLIMNRLRHVLPEVLALSASSPFLEQRDTGLQSWRHSLLDRYPRMGIPDFWEDEMAYKKHIEKLRSLGCLQPEQGLWQDLRLHHRYDTLEVRIMDTHPDIERIGLIVTLLKWEAETIWKEIQAQTATKPWPRSYIDENKWRARRFGLQAKWIDWDNDQVRSTPAHFERWWSRISGCASNTQERNYWERTLSDALSQGTFSEELRRQQLRLPRWENLVNWMSARTHDSVEAMAIPLRKAA